jgi:cell surface protein SprA
LRYQDEALIGAQVLEYNYLLPSALNDQGFYVPVYVLNGVRLSERFNPLIGVNLRTNSNLNLRLDYNKGRDITLNLSNTQVTESRSEDFIIGLGYTARNMKLPFRDSDRKPIVLKNDVLFRVDFAIRDTRTIQRRIGEENVFTAGNRNFQLRPNITYNVDQRLTFQVYFERLINTPRVSNAFVRKDTAFGFQLRYNFTQ